MKITLYFFLFFITACTPRESENKLAVKYPGMARPSNRDSAFLARCALLKIKDLSYSPADSQVRVWVQFPMYSKGRIVDLSKKGAQWQAVVYNFQFGESDDSTFLLSSSQKNGVASASWDSYFNKFRKEKIYSLSDSGRELNSGLCNDGGTITVELVSNGKYRKLIFPCWNVIEDQTEIDKIKEYLKAVETNFQLSIFPIDIEKE